ncbi:MAG TPA: uracil-DNA glycosylase, partial [Steroidobacteraceae bacterium]|nr:uracil-DNA glycosylase [Steroidobacteraceae bacterium]
MDSRRLTYLKALEIDVWERRGLAPFAEVATPAPEQAPAAGSQPDWAELESAVKNCTLCPLHKTRTQGVFGVGNRSAQWMVIGEAPGADEDRLGRPFVGRSGQLLDRMLAAIGMTEADAHITNVVYWRPPGNRTPTPLEAQVCRPFLERQVELVAPE